MLLTPRNDCGRSRRTSNEKGCTTQWNGDKFKAHERPENWRTSNPGKLDNIWTHFVKWCAPRTDFGEQLLLRSLSEIRRDYNFSPIPVQKMARFVSRGEDLQPAFGVVRVLLRSCSLSQTVAIRSISEGNNSAVPNEKRAQNTEKRKINSDVDDEQSKCNGVENKYFLK